MTATEPGPGRRAPLARMARMATAWRSGPLGVPAFRLLTAGQFTSTVGDYCYVVALPWLVLSNHGSAAQLGLVLACYGIPRTALITVGGSLADRLGPRLIMLCSDAARCALTAVFAVFAADHISSLAALAPVAALLGGASALFMPASMAIMPSLLEAGQLAAANAVYTGLIQVGSLVGPVLGGVVVATAGPAAAFGVDAASYLVSAASLALMASAAARRSPAGAEAADEVPADAGQADGPATAPASVWRLLLQARILQIILVVSVTANFALTGTTEVALPALAHARYGAGGYGAVLSCIAVASLVGTIIVTRLRGIRRPIAILAVAFMVAALAIGVAPFVGGLPGVAASMAVFGLALGVDNVLSLTLLQQWAPPAMIGRVMGLLMLAGVGSFPVATAIAGVLTRHLGPSPVFAISGVLIAAAMLFGLTQREFRDFGIRARPDAAGELASDPA
ncbi:MFS transporter [Trebonia sp.]|uniref:MFS transporter n=1 Tax=Trebonia sp. TaxID=2767075 RepID=UPI00262F42DF|nr:MFS transporter [Trebonia sp.]